MRPTVARTAAVFLGLSLFVTAIVAQEGRVDAITGARLRAHLEFVAHDLLEGRDTPSRGLDIAANYIATQLKLWGLEPAGDAGTYFQKIVLERPALDPNGSTLTYDGKASAYGDGFVSTTSGGSGEGGLVFVGHGYSIPELGIDPYAKVEVRGKILIVLQGMPPGVAFRDIATRKYPNALRPAEAAEKYGAIGIVQLPTESNAQNWENLKAQTLRQSGVRMRGSSARPMPTLTLAPALADSLLQGEKSPYSELIKVTEPAVEPEPFALTETKRISFRVAVNANEMTTQNVVAICRGSDPRLSAEYVAIGAHYDHVGMSSTGDGDRIFNGADDDGSGTVAVLEMAHAFAVGPKPKRSILFVWHAGEERGLWGSRYFVDNPTVPIESIVAQLNIDMIGRSKRPGDENPRNARLTDANSIYIVGSYKLSKDLGDICKQTNERLYNLNFDYHYDAPNDPENIYGRSDHYNYALKGIPIAFFFDGVHEDYHRPTDHADKIDYAKMEKVTRTIYATAFTIATSPTRPRLDGKPGGG